MRNKNGFTLLEILIVLGIIGLLLAMTAAAFLSARGTARDAKRKADLEQIRGALETYKADKATYPATSGVVSNSSAPLNVLVSPTQYISTLPTDSLATRQYYYVTLSAGAGYALCASLENSSAGVPANCAGGASCGTACNYSVINP